MLKVIKEIGFKKSLKFVFGVPVWGIFNHLSYPILRAVWLKLLGAQIGQNSVIHQIKIINFYRGKVGNLIIGNDCFIGDDCLLDLADRIVIKDQATLAERVTVLTHTNVGYKDHPLQKYFPAFQKPVVFEEGCFVGVNTTILPGVTVGKEAFVASGSVVTRSISPKTLVAGVPVKIIRKIK